MTRSWLGWAIYLACSWTWCIGMFLPVLLVRDYGIWGWVIFAVPNVIGAAAMGWVIKSPDVSRQMVDAHRPAMLVFSGITATFQGFFGGWIFHRMGLDGQNFMMGMFAVALMAVMFPTLSNPKLGVWIAVVVLVCSALCMTHVLPLADFSVLRNMLDDQPKIAIAPLALVCIFGFALCPYLDLTFHRARQESDQSSARAAFGVGFGVLFLALIFCSLLYAVPLIVYLLDPEFSRATEQWRWWLSVYFLIQLAFTMGVHWGAEAAPRTRRDYERQFMLTLSSALAGIGCWIILRWIRYPRLESGELIYRMFMGFYGLFFPAYVWLCIIPGRGVCVPTKRQAITCAIAILLASPMFWMGFIEGKMIWLLPGLAIVLLARLADYSRPAPL